MNKKKSGIFKIQKRKSGNTFFNKRTGIKQFITIRNVPILHEYKYLGITLDNSLTLNNQLKIL